MINALMLFTNSKYKARLVAKGFTQKEGQDFSEVYSPVAHYPTMRVLLSLALKKDLMANHVDVKTAFLNGNLQE